MLFVCAKEYVVSDNDNQSEKSKVSFVVGFF